MIVWRSVNLSQCLSLYPGWRYWEESRMRCLRLSKQVDEGRNASSSCQSLTRPAHFTFLVYCSSFISSVFLLPLLFSFGFPCFLLRVPFLSVFLLLFPLVLSYYLVFPSCPDIKSEQVRHESLPRLVSLAAGLRVSDPPLVPLSPCSFSPVAPPSCMTIHGPLDRTGYWVSVDFV